MFLVSLVNTLVLSCRFHHGYNCNQIEMCTNVYDFAVALLYAFFGMFMRIG
jgi:hypothetical protein